MDEELKEELRKIYDYENRIDFDPFGKAYIPYKPSIREIDRECIEYIKIYKIKLYPPEKVVVRIQWNHTYRRVWHSA